MTYYLKYVNVERYGAFSGRTVGPFADGLNVVYGPNEAGKTTVASLVGGVLFGWEDTHGVANTYRPETGERSGSLEFAVKQAPEQGTVEASRLAVAGTPGWIPGKTHEPAFGNSPESMSASTPEPSPDDIQIVRRSSDDGPLEGAAHLAADIDKSTFGVMFSLTSDELRSLRSASSVTARLLTAGTGTGSSPSAAFLEIEQRIASCTSVAADAEGSVVALAKQLDDKRAEVRAETERVERFKQDSRELRELEEDRANTAERIDELNREIEELVRCQSSLSAIEEQTSERIAELAEAQRELEEFSCEVADDHGIDKRLLSLDSAQERSLRDRLDEMAEAKEKAARIVDIAKDNSATSSAAYEALVELDETDGSGKGGRGSRNRAGRAQLAAVSIVPTLAFVLSGVPVFVYGRQIGSLSFTALGIGMIVFAFFLAAAAIVMLFRPGGGDDVLAKRLSDAQWVMLQDRKKLASSLQDAGRVDAEIEQLFAESGLSAANGSVRQARQLLDEAAEVRSRIAAGNQRIAALEMRVQSLQEELDDLYAKEKETRESAGFSEAGLLPSIEEQLRAKSDQRNALQDVLNNMNLRYGELGASLELAKNDRSLDALKLEYHALNAQLRDAKAELIKLLLAKRILERSIAAWENRTQPEVYDEASRLLALITNGEWTQVSVSTSGSIVARNAAGQSRKPRHLSLGTCQQLYLALRIALLLSAADVGRAIPVLADDILVNFDASRRAGAARALAELAQRRQVIVFTSHGETVADLQEAGATRLDL